MSPPPSRESYGVTLGGLRRALRRWADLRAERVARGVNGCRAQVLHREATNFREGTTGDQITIDGSRPQ